MEDHEDLASMLEYLALRIRQGDDVCVAVQAMYATEDSQQIYTSERTRHAFDRIQLVGLMHVRAQSISADLNKDQHRE